MFRKVNTMYFSATGTTEKVVCGIAKEISLNMNKEISINNIDFTLPEARKKAVAFTAQDILIIGIPVYAGRVPNILLKYINSIIGNGALAIPVVLYGNRNYDDALIELKDILELNGFIIIGGAAFIGEHAFSKTLAKNRPDEVDMDITHIFANQIYTKIITHDKFQPVVINGNKPYRKHYIPTNKDGIAVDIRKVTPKTNSNCNDCKLCANVCPMGSIDFEDVSKLNGICIKCGACIKKCPTNAKYYDDEDYLRHKQELEANFTCRKDPELFL